MSEGITSNLNVDTLSLCVHVTRLQMPFKFVTEVGNILRNACEKLQVKVEA